MYILAGFMLAFAAILGASVPVMIILSQTAARARMRHEFRSEIARLEAEIESLRDYIDSHIYEPDQGRTREAVEGESIGAATGALVQRADDGTPGRRESH